MNPDQEATWGLSGMAMCVVGAVMVDLGPLYLTGIAFMAIGGRIFWNAFVAEDET